MAKSDGIICQHCGRDAIKPLEVKPLSTVLSLLNIPIVLDSSLPPTVIRLVNNHWEVVAELDLGRS